MRPQPSPLLPDTCYECMAELDEPYPADGSPQFDGFCREACRRSAERRVRRALARQARPRIDEFSGGAVLCTARGARWMDAGEWLHTALTRARKRKAA